MFLEIMSHPFNYILLQPTSVTFAFTIFTLVTILMDRVFPLFELVTDSVKRVNLNRKPISGEDVKCTL